ncbi:hypothetical protein NsoK4_02085 [Nitrosopumilus sp. K4]|uniref:InlB B-repeat-containing protein n=1 Tax=Nitrosopumilus sp. K4 TaxID=2795383 RepID=UPI001BA94889|nr:hypothetical protein [Nitrosopumilus sp. K4]QUC65081.1 hypothetical protein NsoK4_02085 [Nitrosopumilus sp. K4]
MNLKLFVFLFIFSSFLFGTSFDDTAFSQTSNLFVIFEDDVSESYEVPLSSDGKYVLNQNHSWVRDESSRFNLVSYSVDGKDSVSIDRTPRGVIHLEIPGGVSQIVFSAVPQYPLVISGTDEYSFLPTSPTNDNWFDAGSEISVTVPTTIPVEKNKVRQEITGWALDKHDFRNLPENESNFFITPPITMSQPHVIDFVSQTQYKLNVVSDIGTTTGSGWYKQDDEVSISASAPMEGFTMNVLIGWDGPVIESDGDSAKVIIDGPTTITAKWEKNSSLGIVLVVIPAVIVAGIVVKKFKKPKKSPSESELAYVTKPEISEKKSNNKNFEKEFSEYFSKQVLDHLESLHNSKLISDSKYSKIKKRL